MNEADAVALLLRLVLGAVMIAHGLNHWRGGGRIKGTARWFTGLGLTHGTLQAWLSVVTEVGAGVLLPAGLFTPLACAAVISVMLVAVLLAHRPNGFFVFKEGYEYVLTLAVVSLALAVLGPGSFGGRGGRHRCDRLGGGWHRARRGRGGDRRPARRLLAPEAFAAAVVRTVAEPRTP
jgi:uncharacterized membrane protein YphA (DoxX/SURF4 family)